MKTKLIKSTILFILIFVGSNLKAETIFFDSKNIKIEDDGNMIFATKGNANIPSKNLIIQGDKFIYDKKISELIILDDVKYFDSENKIYIESDKVIYNEINNTIFSKNETYINNDEIYKLKFPIKNVLSNPKKIDLTKENQFRGKLTGIKGQYLIFNDQYYINIRNNQGYLIDLEII